MLESETTLFPDATTQILLRLESTQNDPAETSTGDDNLHSNQPTTFTEDPRQKTEASATVLETLPAQEPKKTFENRQSQKKIVMVPEELDEIDMILHYAWKLLSWPVPWAQKFLSKGLPKGLHTFFRGLF